MIFYTRCSLPKLTEVLCCDSHEFADAEDARPPTKLPPPTYVHTYTLAVIIPYTDNVHKTRVRRRRYQYFLERKLLYSSFQLEASY